MLSRLSLTVVFRESGWRRPLADPVTIEVWGPTGLVATLPASHLLALIRWHLEATRLQGALQQHVTGEVTLPRLPGAAGRKLRGR